LGSDGVLGKEFFPPVSVASRRDGHTFLEWIKVGMLFELLAKLLAACFEEFDVRLAVRLHFGLQYKVVIGIDFLLVPPFEFRFLLGGHTIGIVRVFGRHGSFVVLVFHGVEFVREKSLTQFRDAKGGRENGRKHSESLKVRLCDLNDKIFVPMVI